MTRQKHEELHGEDQTEQENPHHHETVNEDLEIGDNKVKPAAILLILGAGGLLIYVAYVVLGVGT
ncbi:MAG: hypothetical protein HY820_12500 [Acidobacteria bacterium]|nr:hypothetical protein [Acidobacteriota bacterium]